jgi:hypothetical protein
MAVMKMKVVSLMQAPGEIAEQYFSLFAFVDRHFNRIGIAPAEEFD